MDGWYIDTTTITIMSIPYPTLLYTLLHIPSVMELKSFFGRPVDDGVAKESLSDRVRTSMDPAAAGGLNSMRLLLCCVVDKWDS
jgi:esterase/lipase superfamily enzyme